MQETILVEKGGSAFYAPADQAARWGADGYAVYRIEAVPLNSAAREGSSGTAEMSCTASAPQPEMEVFGE